MVTYERVGTNGGGSEPRHILVACRSEMFIASLTELLAKHGYGVTGVTITERACKLIDARPIALVVLVGRGDAAEIELVRTAKSHRVPTLLVAISQEGTAPLVVDGEPVLGVSNAGLIASIQATIGGPIDTGPKDPAPRAA